MSFKTSSWSPDIIPQEISHRNYLEHFSYQHLKRAEFEKVLSWKLLHQEQELATWISGYLVKTHGPAVATDSLRVIVFERYMKHDKLETDTLYVSKYTIGN